MQGYINHIAKDFQTNMIQCHGYNVSKQKKKSRTNKSNKNKSQIDDSALVEIIPSSHIFKLTVTPYTNLLFCDQATASKFHGCAVVPGC